jgi:hypothetical protein
MGLKGLGLSPVWLVVVFYLRDGHDDENELGETDEYGIKAIRVCCNPLSLVLAPGSSFRVFLLNFKP